MKKTILIVNDIATIGGGASRIAIKSAIELSKDPDYEVLFFAANGRVDEELENNTRIQTTCIKTTHIAHNRNVFKVLQYGLWNQYAAEKFEVVLSSLDPKTCIVHVHGWTKALSVSVIAKALEKGIQVLITLHDYFSVCPNGGFYNYRTKELCSFIPLSRRCLFCNCDKRAYVQKAWRCIRQFIQNKYVSNNKYINYIYISDRVLSLSRSYLLSDKFFFLRNPIELAQSMEMTHEKSNKYIYVGRVSEEKGVEDFCRAITKAQADQAIIGQVIGTGPLQKQLENKYRNIEFTGWANDIQMHKYYSEARCLIFPSICNEGSPLTIPEALSHGLPCIVSDCTSAAEMIVNGKTGLVFRAKDVDDLLAKVYSMSDNNIVASYQKNISASFQSSEYSYALHVKSLKQIYCELLKGI